MTNKHNKKIMQLLSELSECMLKETPLSQDFYDELQENPEFGIDVLRLFPTLDEDNNGEVENNGDEELIMASFHFIELCLVHLRIASDHNQPWADKLIQLYQDELATLMDEYPTLSCWMPIINLFFSADIKLNDTVKNTYISMLEISQKSEQDARTQQILMQQLLSDDSDNSEFEIAELFFAQTSALPKEYFPAFVGELLSFKANKAINTAVLFLLHPDSAIRHAVLKDTKELFLNTLLPPESTSRLPVIRQWLPDTEKHYIDTLLLNQRKKGVEFATLTPSKIIDIHATEMDGSGAQAIFFLIKHGTHYQATGVLIKRHFGIKDTWLSPPLNKERAKNYATQGMSKNIILRKVDKFYVELLLAHHIYQGQRKGSVPNVSLLALQEMMGLNWQANPLNITKTLAELKETLPEIDEAWIEKSLKRSGRWYKNKTFTESWFDESAELDRIVNTHCSFVDGTKFCNIENATIDVMEQYLEPKREQWVEHFVWMALWAKPHARYNEYLWKDCYLLASLLKEGCPIEEIPLMHVISEHNILTSVETMEYRKTHLS